MSGMGRREFVALLGGAAAWPVAARAQQPANVWRVGFLAGASRPASLGSSVYGGFVQGMRELGYVEGADFTIEWRFAEGRFELFPALAAELVRPNVDVIVVGAGNAVPAVQQATKNIPVVMGSSLDPVGRGFVVAWRVPAATLLGSRILRTTPRRNNWNS
jgi:putative ABC transport system substrate-binding protein